MSPVDGFTLSPHTRWELPDSAVILSSLLPIGHIHNVDVQLPSKDGKVGDYLLSVETVTIHQERCVLNVMLDITERKQTESQLLSAIESVMQDTS